MALFTFLFVLAGWFFSLCLHEFAHAYVAYKGGDTSVKARGYLSFNLFRYLDPMPSFIFPMLILLLGGLGLPGGAVYIQTHLIRSPWMRAFMSFAGPLMNLLLAFVLAFILTLPNVQQSIIGPALAFLILLQMSAFMLNLLPIPGFDGFGVIAPFLPVTVRNAAYRYANVAMIILIVVLLLPTPFSKLLFSVIYHSAALLTGDISLIFEGWHAFQFWKH